MQEHYAEWEKKISQSQKAIYYSFHLYNILEMTKLQRWRTDSLVAKGQGCWGEEGEYETREDVCVCAQSFLPLCDQTLASPALAGGFFTLHHLGSPETGKPLG